MKKDASDPIAVIDLPPEHELSHVAALVRSAMRDPPAGMPQVKWRIRTTVRRHEEWRRRALRACVVGALLFVAGGVVGAVVQPVFLSPRRSVVPLPSEPSPSSAHQGRKRQRLPPSAQDSPEVIAELPSTAPVALAESEIGEDASAGNLPPQAPSRLTSATPSQPGARLSYAPAARVRMPSGPPAELPVSRPGEVLARGLVSGKVASATPAPPAEPPMNAARVLDDRPSPLVPAPVPPAPPLAALALPPPPPVRAPPPPQIGSENAQALGPADERGLLGAALRRLRIEHDPSRALALLAEHAARFPDGALAPEAARLRTEALMLLGWKDVALAELDRQADSLPGSDERRVLRGELRASAGQWRTASADFDTVVRSLSQARAADVKARECLERAIWGRASARSQLGDQAGARADLADYLDRFPGGRFAAEARRLLHERR